MELASGQNLEQFFKQWLYTPGHPQLGITWKYIADKGVVELNITQKQDTLFEFPLEVSIDKQLHTTNIKDKSTRVEFPVTGRPAVVSIDPDVNLLAGFEVSEGN